MHLRQLSVVDFRSYPSAELPLKPGVTTLIGLNGQGKTNLIEAVGYLATLGSHRVASDTPLVRAGTQQAIIRGVVVRDGHETLIELTRQPRWAGVRSDYDKVLKQRNALLKSAAPVLRRGVRRAHRSSTPLSTEPGDKGVDDGDSSTSALHTLDVWNSQLAMVGAQLLYARLRLMRDLSPYLSEAYDEVSAATSDARISYRSSLREEMSAAIAAGAVPEMQVLHDEMLASLEAVRVNEIERGISLVGPHRDDVVLSLGQLPAKGYASHGESWSFALGLRLAAYQLLRHDLGDDPILILDDVFAELDSGRRDRLAALIADCEQVLITAAFPGDVPTVLSDSGTTYRVALGEVGRAD